MSENILQGKQDQQTVTSDGLVIQDLPQGVSFYNVPTQVDERGTLTELYDPRWNWHPAPLVYAYNFTIQPGIVKGWAMHKQDDDRDFILCGTVEVVLYDGRAESATCGLVATIVLSEYQRRLLCIPAGVWHAYRNIGTTEAIGINFPTMPYDHSDPDKYRLPLDTDQIPHKFDNPRGW